MVNTVIATFQPQNWRNTSRFSVAASGTQVIDRGHGNEQAGVNKRLAQAPCAIRLVDDEAKRQGVNVAMMASNTLAVEIVKMWSKHSREPR